MRPETVMALTHRPDIQGLICAGLPDHWHQAARLKLSLDVSDRYKIELKLFDIALSMKDRLGWKIKKGDEGVMMLWRMARLAVWELSDPGRFRCADAYKIYINTLGIDKSNWSRTWQSRYELLYQELDEWVNRAYRFMKMKSQRTSRVAREIAMEVLSGEEQALLEQFRRVG